MRAPRPLRVAACLCVALLPALARAEPPQGAYSLTLSGASTLALPAGTAADQCLLTKSGLVCLTSELATDAAGVVTGTASLTRLGDIRLELALALDGRVAGTTAKPKARLTFTATGAAKGPDNAPPPEEGQPPPPEERDTLDVAGDGRMSCRLASASRFMCAAKARLCLFHEGVQIDCVPFSFVALLPAERTPLELDLELATDARKRVTGDAQLRLGERPPIACSARGKHARRSGASSLRLACSTEAVEAQLALEKAVLQDGGAASGTLVFEVAGQKGKVDLAPPAPPPP